jgi:hypothetical protein
VSSRPARRVLATAVRARMAWFGSSGGDRQQEGGERAAVRVRRQEFCVRSMASVTRQRSGIVGV